MSLVSTYVFADDGCWYQDPVIGEGQDWFLCYDDDEPIELVIALDSQYTFAEVLEKLREAGYKPKNSARAMVCGRCFGDDVAEVKKAQSWFLHFVEGRMPTKFLLSHHGKHEKEPQREGVYYSGDPRRNY